VSNHSKIQYRQDIDGLRALAVLFVVLHHAFPELIPGGYIGVDIFFVISGYLISSIILSGIERSDFRLSDFYYRRIKRIFPSLIVVIVAVLLAGYFLFLPSLYQSTGAHALAGSFFYSNYLYLSEFGYFDLEARSKPFLHLWSLAVEEHFYIFWPMLLLAFNKHARPMRLILFVLAISFLYQIYLVFDQPNQAFYDSFGRFWELMIGSLLAVYSQASSRLYNFGQTYRNALGLFGLVVLFVLAFGLSERSMFPGFWALLVGISSALVIWAGLHSCLNRKLLSIPAIVYVGKVSYPFYLWHWPLLVIASLLYGEDEVRFWAASVSVVISFVFSVVTYHFIENPLRFKLVANWSRALLFLVIPMLVVASIGAYVSNKKGLPERFPGHLSELLKGTGAEVVADGWRHECFLDFDVDPVFGDVCTELKRPMVFLWGDSHAASLYPGFKAAQDKNVFEFGLVERTGAICPPVLDHEPRPRCRDLNHEAMSAVKELKPDVVVLYAFWHENRIYQRYDLTNLGYTVDQIKQAGVDRIYLVGTVPFWKKSLPDILLEKFQQDPDLEYFPKELSKENLDPYVLASDASMRAFSVRHNIEYVSGIDFFCNKEGCRTTVGADRRIPISYDYGHLTQPAVEVFVHHLLQKVFDEQ